MQIVKKFQEIAIIGKVVELPRLSNDKENVFEWTQKNFSVEN